MNSRFTQDTGATPQQHKTVHLCVDLQLGCVAGLSDKGARNYLENMGDAIEGLRERDIPTLWIAIDDATEMRPRAQAWSNDPAAPARGLDTPDMKPFTGITGMAEKPDNEEVYRQFLADHGPKAGEDVQHKRQLDAFASRKSLDENPKLYEHVTSHLKDETREKVDASFKGASMADHLQAQGTEHVLISGMDAFVCALDTGRSARRATG